MLGGGYGSILSYSEDDIYITRIGVLGSVLGEGVPLVYENNTLVKKGFWIVYNNKDVPQKRSYVIWMVKYPQHQQKSHFSVSHDSNIFFLQLVILIYFTIHWFGNIITSWIYFVLKIIKGIPVKMYFQISQRNNLPNSYPWTNIWSINLTQDPLPRLFILIIQESVIIVLVEGKASKYLSVRNEFGFRGFYNCEIW